MGEPLISVLIPVYNAAATLPLCLGTVLGQTHQNLEVVAVDDGSTDGSAQLLEGFAAQDARVRVVRQANAGSAAARNTALAHACGGYIAWVDADDYVWPTFLEHLLALCGRLGTRLAMCRGEVVHDAVLPAAPRDRCEPDCTMDFETYCEAIYTPREVEMVVLWNKLYEADLWEGVRFPEGRSIDDEAVVWRLVHRAGRIAVSTLPLYFYYQSPQSVMRGAGAALRRVDGLVCLEERGAFFDQNGYAYLAYRNELSILLGAFEIRRSLGRTPEEKAVRRTLRALRRRHLVAISHRPECGRRRALRLWRWHFIARAFEKTSRAEQLFYTP